MSGQNEKRRMRSRSSSRWLCNCKGKGRRWHLSVFLLYISNLYFVFVFCIFFVWGARAVAGGSARARAGDDISSSLYTLNIALCNVMLWQLHLAIWNWRQCYPYSVPRWQIWIGIYTLSRQNTLIGDNPEYNVYSILCMLVYFSQYSLQIVHQ